MSSDESEPDVPMSVANEFSVNPTKQEPTGEDQSGSNSSASSHSSASSVDDDLENTLDRLKPATRHGRLLEMLDQFADPPENEEDRIEVTYDLLPEHLEALENSLHQAIANAGTIEDVGVAIYDLILAGAGEHTVLFKSPKLVMAQRFMMQTRAFVEKAGDIDALDHDIYAMALRHIAYVSPEVLALLMKTFALAIVNALRSILDDDFDDYTEESWLLLLVYVGHKLYINLKEFSGKVHRVQRTWRQLATASTSTATAEVTRKMADGTKLNTEEEYDVLRQEAEERRMKAESEAAKKAAQKSNRNKAAQYIVDMCNRGKNADAEEEEEAKGKKKKKRRGGGGNGQTTDRRLDNGDDADNGEEANFGQSLWFNMGVMAPEVSSGFRSPRDKLARDFTQFFSDLTKLVSDPQELNENIFVLGARHLKYKFDVTHIDVFGQAVMVTLRSLLPRTWDHAAEEAWLWLWGIVARQMEVVLSSAPRNKALIDDSMDRLANVNMGEFGMEFYEHLFSQSKEVQNYFYKPISTIQFIVNRVLELLSSVYHSPTDASSFVKDLGLRHIKYAVPPALFHLFGSSLIHSLSRYMEGYWTDDCEDAWTAVFEFVQKMMTRATNGGTNLVTRSVVTSSVDTLMESLEQAPRSQRAKWCLEIDVSGRRLSPLYWAVHDGKLEVARVMLEDVLAIRADREAYYCGKDTLFKTHPGVVKTLSMLAPALLFTLADGLMWNSRLSVEGRRRVNYYFRDLYGDPNYKRYFDPYHTPLQDLVALNNPLVFNHLLIKDLVATKWTTLARGKAASQQVMSIVSLLLFMVAYAALTDPDATETVVMRWIVLVVNVLQFALYQVARLYQEFQNKQVGQVELFEGSIKFSLPLSLLKVENVMRLLVNAFVFCGFGMDPAIAQGGPTESPGLFRLFMGLASLLLWFSLVDLFSSNLLTAEVRLRAALLTPDAAAGMLWLGLGTIAVSLAAGNLFQLASVVHTVDGEEAYPSISYPTTDAALTKYTLPKPADVRMQVEDAPKVYSQFFDERLAGFTPSLQSAIAMGAASFDVNFELYHEEARAVMVLLLIVVCWVLLPTLSAVFISTASVLDNEQISGMVIGQRAKEIVELESLVSVSLRRRVFASLKFDERLEFDEGDQGMAGGVARTELANLVDAHDRIQRFPGVADPQLPWPQQKTDEFIMSDYLDDIVDRAQRNYKLVREIGKKAGVKGDNASASASGMMSKGGSTAGGHSMSGTG